MDPKRALLGHFLAALAYRTQKALRGAPATFATFEAAPGVRTPHQIVRHMSGVINYGIGRATRERARLESLESFPQEVARLHALLAELSGVFAGPAPLASTTEEALLQGPLSDAMTHAGQLAMLRRLAGSPVPPENFIEAAIRADNVGPNQPAPTSPDTVWPEAPPGWVPPAKR